MEGPIGSYRWSNGLACTAEEKGGGGGGGGGFQRMLEKMRGGPVGAQCMGLEAPSVMVAGGDQRRGVSGA
jgi:hypothetical protein